MLFLMLRKLLILVWFERKKIVVIVMWVISVSMLLLINCVVRLVVCDYSEGEGCMLVGRVVGWFMEVFV